jgi:hypothetical protein
MYETLSYQKDKSILQELKNCNWCNKNLEIIKKCSICGIATYCTKECQIKDWKFRHKVNKKQCQYSLLNYFHTNDLSMICSSINSNNINNLITINIKDINIPDIIRDTLNISYTRTQHIEVSLLTYALTLPNVNIHIINYLLGIKNIKFKFFSIFTDIINNPFIIAIENTSINEEIKELLFQNISTTLNTTLDNTNTTLDNTINNIIEFDLINSFKYLIDKNIIHKNYIISKTYRDAIISESLLSIACKYRKSYLNNNILNFLINEDAELEPSEYNYIQIIDDIKINNIKDTLIPINKSDDINMIMTKINTNVNQLIEMYYSTKDSNKKSLYRKVGNCLYRDYIDKYAWCFLTKEGTKIIFDIIYSIPELDSTNIVEVGGGSGFNSAYLKYIHDLEYSNKPIDIICTDPQLDISSYSTTFYTVEKIDAIATINKYNSRILFVSRAREFITNTTELFINNGGLIIIMLGEECHDETDRSCAPSSFYKLIKRNQWKSKRIDNGIIDWSLFGINDVFVIHYSPSLIILSEYLDKI